MPSLRAAARGGRSNRDPSTERAVQQLRRDRAGCQDRREHGSGIGCLGQGELQARANCPLGAVECRHPLKTPTTGPPASSLITLPATPTLPSHGSPQEVPAWKTPSTPPPRSRTRRCRPEISRIAGNSSGFRPASSPMFWGSTSGRSADGRILAGRVCRGRTRPPPAPCCGCSRTALSRPSSWKCAAPRAAEAACRR